MKNNVPTFLLICRASHTFGILYKYDLMVSPLHIGFSLALNKLSLTALFRSLLSLG